jgi:hypothetical protein
MLLITEFLYALVHRIAYRDGMPTLTVTHEAPLELIRQHPSLALELVRATLNVPLPEGLEARLGPTDLNYVVPAEFTADSVVTLHDPVTGEPALAVIVEPQGRDDADKQYSWPAYVTNVRRAAKCPRAVLVVICPDPVEGEKCRKGIPTGHPGFDLLPIVILKAAPAAARQILEDLMATTEWKSDFVESFVNVGIERGIEQGLEQGRVLGIAEGAIRAKAEDILKILNARNLKPTKSQRGQINAATDLAQLDRWFDRALTAAAVAEVFAD